MKLQRIGHVIGVCSTILTLMTLFTNCEPGSSVSRAPDGGNSILGLEIPYIDTPDSSGVVSNLDSITLAGTCLDKAVVHLVGSAYEDDVTSPPKSLDQTCSGGRFSFTIAKSIDGLFTFAVNQTAKGLTSDTSQLVAWFRDTVAPSAPGIDVPVSNPAYSSIADASINVQGTCEEKSTVKVAGAGTGTANCVAGYFSIDLPQPVGSTNAFNYTLTQTDRAGNTSSKTLFQWYREDIPKTPTITAPIKSPTYSNLDKFEIKGTCETGWKVTLTGADDDSVTCANSTYSFKSFIYDDGDYEFAVTQTNNLGDTSAPAITRWNRDTESPAAPTISLPVDNPLLTASSSISLAGSCETDADVVLTAPGGATQHLTCPDLGVYAFPITVAGDGSFLYTLQQTDLAGNASSSVTFELDRDTSIPATPILNSPLTASYISNTDGLDISGTCTNGFVVTIGGDYSSRQTCTDGGFSFSIDKSSGSGTTTYSFDVHQTSRTGIDSASANVVWVQDKVPPANPRILNPAISSYEASGNNLVISGSCENHATVNLTGDSAQAQTCVDGEYSFTVSKITDATYTFYVSQTDRGSNASGAVGLQWIRNSVAPPAPVILAPADLVTYNSEPTLTVSGLCTSGNTVNLSGYFGNNHQTCESGAFSFDVSGSADGGYAFSVSQTHADLTSGTETKIYVLDRVAPDTAIRSQPASLTNDKYPTFTFAGSEAGSFMCQLDSAAYAPCLSGIGYNVADGNHTFNVYAIDRAGNSDSTPSTMSFTVDSVAPVLTIASGPTGNINTGNVVVTFSATKPSTFRCWVDGGASSTCTSPASFSGFANGSHTIVIQATDAAGNDSSAKSVSFTVDTVAPTLTLTAGPDTFINTSGATLEFSANETGVSFQCKLDAGTAANCTSPKTYSSLSSGAHTVLITGSDAAGNPATNSLSVSFTVDTTAPTVSIASISSYISTNSLSVSFSSNESNSTFQCKLDSGSYAACTSPLSLTSLAEGSHTVSVKATDRAGNTSNSSSRSFTVDTTPPVITFTSKPSNPTTSSSASFAWTADDSGTSFNCKVDSGNYSNCNGSKSYNSGSFNTGTHVFYVEATNQAGLTSTTTYTWVKN